MRRFRKWMIGDYLVQTNNVFLRSRIELLFNFTTFYLLNVILFLGNVISNHYYYHAAILGLSVPLLILVLIILRLHNFEGAAKMLLLNQTIVGIVSYLIQRSTMDFVGEFFIVVNILIAFFTLGKKFGIIVSMIWLLQIIHCLANDVSGGKYVLFNTPAGQVLPPAPFFVLVPFGLCFYIIYQFVKTHTLAEQDIQAQKAVIENKNKEITDSIHYAKRIQQSLLPTEKYLAKKLRSKTVTEPDTEKN